MIRFRIQDMTCGHCVAHVTDAIRSVLPAARVDIDLATKLATIDGSDAGDDSGGDAGNAAGGRPVGAEAGKAGNLRERLAEAITDAGYTPESA